jgi:hypothetical protein
MQINSTRIRSKGHAVCVEDIINAYILFGRHERKTPSRRLTHGWEYNIVMDLRKMWLEGVD